MLKQLIQRLLDSRTTPAEAAHSAMPSDGTTTTLASDLSAGSAWVTLKEGIAPNDGYVTVSAKSVQNTSTIDLTSGNVGTNLKMLFTNNGSKAFIPVRKGAKWSIAGSNAKEIFVYFCTAIGGGLRLLSALFAKGVIYA